MFAMSRGPSTPSNLTIPPANPLPAQRLPSSSPLGLQPSHLANSQELQRILTSAESLRGKGLSYANIKCNEFVARAINDAYPGALPFAYTTSQISSGQGPFRPTATPTPGSLALFTSPSHVVLVTQTNAGRVTQFIGSQTSTGPAYVNLPDNYYWGPKINAPGNVAYFDICLPDRRTHGVA